MTPSNGVRGFPLAIIFVIGLLTQFTTCEDWKCYTYRCANKNTDLISTVVPNLKDILLQFPVTSYCAQTEPVDHTSQCIQVDQDSSGCLAVITTMKIPYQGELKLVYKNCTNVLDCYQQVYGKIGGDPKCHLYTYAELQGGQGSTAGESEITEFQKCAEGKGEDLTGGLGQAVGQDGRQGKGKQGKDGRQGDLGGAQELAKDVTLGFCICKGNMCNEHSKIDKALDKMMGKGSTTPANNEAQGLLVSKGVFSVLIGVHFYSSF